VGALAVSPSVAGAATLKLPTPAAGEVAVAAAPVTGALKVPKAGVPKGVAVTGGVVTAGGKKLALVAVVRPKKTAKPAAKATAAKLGAGSSAAAVLAAAPAGALTAAVAPACPSGAATALGKVLRRGAGAPTASDLKTLGKVLAARLCDQDVDAKGGALLGLLGLNAAAARPAKPAPAGPAAGGVVGATSTATPPAPGGGGSAPGGGPSGGGSTPPAGGPQCANGKDDDGDGQVDALGKGAPFFDPGCKDAADTTENSEKATPRACGLGIYTHATRRGFGVDFDSLSYDECPKPMVKGVVDLASPIVTCDVPGWEGGKGNASCDQQDGALVIAAGQGGQWQTYGDAAADLCGTKGTIVGYTADGQAWEQTMPVFDGEKVCEGPPPGDKACNNGVDDDHDGQVDLAGLPGAGPDPGCSSATDASEDSEVAFPATGCWPVVAADPGDATVAWLYLIPLGPANSCPAMDAAWFTFDAIKATACLSDPYFDGQPAGTCEVKGGDVHVSGGQGNRIAVAVQLDTAIDCNTYKPGHADMRTLDGAIHDGVFDDAYFDQEDVLRECR
jgi:hypothetical protein